MKKFRREVLSPRHAGRRPQWVFAAAVVAVAVVGCGGGEEASSDAAAQDSRDGRAGALGASTWVSCASQGQVCSFSGTTLVRYGSSGKYFYLPKTTSVSCTDQVFGDPNYGFAKSCWYDSATSSYTKTQLFAIPSPVSVVQGQTATLKLRVLAKPLLPAVAGNPDGQKVKVSVHLYRKKIVNGVAVPDLAPIDTWTTDPLYDVGAHFQTIDTNPSNGWSGYKEFTYKFLPPMIRTKALTYPATTCHTETGLPTPITQSDGTDKVVLPGEYFISVILYRWIDSDWQVVMNNLESNGLAHPSAADAGYIVGSLSVTAPGNGATQSYAVYPNGCPVSNVAAGSWTNP